MDIKKAIEEVNSDLNAINDPAVKVIFVKLLNIIEAQATEIKKLREENQRLRDENNRLKGEQERPSFRKQTQNNNANFSSEEERKQTSEEDKKLRISKRDSLSIDETQICKIDAEQLPPDAVFKGYKSVVIQDIVIKPYNIEFKKAIYYSPSLNKTFVAPLPSGYQGEFGPRLKALLLELHHQNKMTESSLVEFLHNHGIHISAATVSRLLTERHEDFHEEKKAIVEAGLASFLPQQMDDTGARVNGKNYYTHILCNAFYTAYFTRANKERLTILEILTQGELTFHFNEGTYSLMEELHLSKKILNRLREQPPKAIMNRIEIDAFLEELLPDAKKHAKARHIILEGSAISAYQTLPQHVRLLLADDAPQFKKITELLGLCWVHDGRHYKKLAPVLSIHQEQLTLFLEKYWLYYRKLLAYQKQPNTAQAELLRTEFDTLFATKTDYEQLDDRIEKTKLKKESLLLVLTHPELPLHNNASELGARTQARYRDISFHTINEKGTEAKDTFMTIVGTAKKMAVNTYHYFYDRVSGTNEMPSLASLIKIRSEGLSYNTG